MGGEIFPFLRTVWSISSKREKMDNMISNCFSCKIKTLSSSCWFVLFQTLPWAIEIFTGRVSLIGRRKCWWFMGRFVISVYLQIFRLNIEGQPKIPVGYCKLWSCQNIRFSPQASCKNSEFYPLSWLYASGQMISLQCPPKEEWWFIASSY